MKVAFLGLKPGDGVAPADVASLSGYVQSQLAQLGPYAVVGTDEIQSLLGLERKKQLLGCDDSGCLAEIGGALGVERALTGTVSRLGEALLLNLSLLDLPHARVVARLGRRVTSQSSLEPLLDVVSPMLSELAAADGHPVQGKTVAAAGSMALVGAVDLAPLGTGGRLGGFGGLRLAYGFPRLQAAVTLLAPTFGFRGEVILPAPFTLAFVRPYLGLGGGLVDGVWFGHAGLGLQAHLSRFLGFVEVGKELLFSSTEALRPLLVGGGLGLAF